MAEGLAGRLPARAGRVLLPQAEGARPVLADGLRAAGWDVEAVVAYRTVAGRPRAGRAWSGPGGGRRHHVHVGLHRDGVLAAAGPGAVPPVVVCIGPVTAAAAGAAGLAVTTVAAEHTIDGLIAAVVTALRRPT